jgi:hypothetical protein
MKGETQISAHISIATKARMEKYVRRTGVTRGRLVEDALAHHLQALEEIPAELVVPSRIVLSPESADRVIELIDNPPKPTAAMRRLLRGR